MPCMQPDVLLEALSSELAASGIDPTGWVLCWARLLPSLILIPAFGLPGFPIVIRVGFASVLAAVVAPSLPVAAYSPGPLLLALGAELARGLPVALSAAFCVWGALMAGNLIDELRAGAPPLKSPFDAGEPSSPLGILLSLAASVAFFRLGGPARLADALAVARPLHEQDLHALVSSLAHGVQFAVALAGPLLALVPFLELLHALVARSTAPISAQVVFGPFKAVALLGMAAVLLDRIAAGVVVWMDGALPPS
jgi:type III secretory pathway component EscT